MENLWITCGKVGKIGGKLCGKLKVDVVADATSRSSVIIHQMQHLLKKKKKISSSRLDKDFLKKVKHGRVRLLALW